MATTSTNAEDRIAELLLLDAHGTEAFLLGLQSGFAAGREEQQ